MSSDRFVVKSSGAPVIGSQFTLTLAPVVVDGSSSNARASQANENCLKETHVESESNRIPQSQVGKERKEEVDERLFNLFKDVAGVDLEVDAFELQSVVGNIFKRDFGMVKKFSIECCRSLIVMVDTDRSGKLDYPQFKRLFRWILDTRKVYQSYENSQSWDMDSRDLKQVMHNLSYDISSETIELIATKYRNRMFRIDFDDFLQICARLKSCHDSYHSYQTVGDSFDEFIMHIIYT